MTQSEVLDHLDRNTHSLFTADFLKVANEAFGTDIKPWTYKANPRDPKGLTLNDGAKTGIGLAAFHLAAQLCGELGVEYEEKFGRGSQVRACTEALRNAGYGKEPNNS